MTEFPEQSSRATTSRVPIRSPDQGKARRDSFYLFVLGSIVFVLLGFALEAAAPVSTVDFRVVYFSARCLIEHHDPYNPKELDAVYRTEKGETAQDSPQIRRSERHYNYLPTAFALTVPFALLPFGMARLVWLLLIAFLVILASYLVWAESVQSQPTLSGVLVCLSLLTSELFLILGNPAGFAVALCVIAVWCFLKQRFVLAGIFCFALSLLLKPHDAGFIWLYFLLAGGVYRRRALQTLLAVCVLGLPFVLWVTAVAPGWLHELEQIVAAYAAHGDVNDPGPASMASHGIGMVICLQAVLSVFRDDPAFYNPLTYLLCGALLVLWALRTLAIRHGRNEAWVALAPVAALSMLPVYHRVYDAKLLLLAVPACALLWGKGGRLVGWTVAVSAFTIAITGAMPWAIFLFLLHHGRLPAFLSSAPVSTVLQVFPVPLALVATGVLWLAVYMKAGPQAWEGAAPAASGGQLQGPGP
jgi:glycosyl transferase family 87